MKFSYKILKLPKLTIIVKLPRKSKMIPNKCSDYNGSLQYSCNFFLFQYELLESSIEFLNIQKI